MDKLIIRKLKIDDLKSGFLESLESLRTTKDIDESLANEIFERINSNPDHIIMVAELDGKIVGSTTLLIEQKFIHKGGKVGHIEDVVVDRKFQGQKIGQKIIQKVLETSRECGCYKTILDCNDEIRPFYEKMKFFKSGNEMRFNHQ